MRLYKDKALLNQAIAAASRHFKVDPSIVEKDYYASVFLKRLSGQLPELLLTGGASLSKCYRVINRFSDNIDLTLTQDRDQITTDQRKQVKKAIKGVCLDLGFSLLNENDIKSRKDFNRCEIDYSPKRGSIAIKAVINVDLSYPAKAPAYESMPVSSLIYEYMEQAGQEDFIRQYKLQPFSMPVRTMDRALADRIFDLCDSYLAGRIPGHSYILYDISRLIEHVLLDDGFASEFQSVRAERAAAGSPSAAVRTAAGSPSAADAAAESGCFSTDGSCSISGLLSEILDKNVYKRDYYSVTAHTLFDGVSYEEAAAGLQLLAGSGLLDPQVPQPGR